MKTEVWIVSNYPPPVHGVSVFTEQVMNYLNSKNVPVRLFRVGTRGKFGDIETFRFRKLIHDISMVLAFLFSFLSEVFSNKKIIVYFTPSQAGFGIFRDFLVSKISKIFACKLVAHLHGCKWLYSLESCGFIKSKMLYESLKTCDHVICLGETYAKKMKLEANLPTVGVNNGIAKFDEFINESSPNLNKPLTLFFLSNLMRSKGLWVAAETVRSLIKKNVDVTLICGGLWMREDEESEFLNEFKEEITSGSIKLVGFVDQSDKHKIFETVDFLILPIQNPYEGQPLSLLEAMSFGIIPLTTRFGGIPDLFTFEGGAVFANEDYGTPSVLADTILEIARDPKRYRALSELCYKIYQESLTFKLCAIKIQDILFEGIPFALKDEPLRVLAIGPLPPPLAGVERATKQLIMLLKKIENFKVTTFNTQIHQDNVRKGNLSFTRALKLPYQIFKLFRTTLHDKPQVALLGISQNFTGLTRDCALILVLKIRAIRTFGWIHGERTPMFLNTHPIGFLFKKILNTLNGFIVPNPRLIPALNMSFPNIPITDIPHTLEPSFMEQSGVPQHKFDFTFVGKIAASKGWNDFAWAIQQFKKENIKLSLKTVGELIPIEKNVPGLVGTSLRHLELLEGTNHQLQANDKELFDILTSSRAAVLPSYSESFCFVAAEAMACGTPVIGYKNEGMQYLLGKEFSEFLVDIGDKDGLLRLMNNVLGLTAEENIILGKRFKDRIKKLLKGDEVVGKWENLFKSEVKSNMKFARGFDV